MANAMKIVIAPQAFKGSISALDAAKAIDAGVRSVAVTFGYAHVPYDELGADALINHFDDLAGALVDISKAAAS